MKILMISNEFPPSLGGVQTHVFELSRALVSAGHTVTVMTRRKDDTLPATEVLGGVKINRIRLPRSHWLYDRVLRSAIKSHVRSMGVDVVHVHGMRPLNACRRIGVPVVFTNHTSSFLKRLRKGARARRKMARALGHISYGLAPSEERVEAMRLTGCSAPLMRIPSGVDLDRFRPEPVTDVSRIVSDPEAFVGLFSGRLHPVKGIEILAKAVIELNSADFHLVVAGDGPEKHRLIDAFESIGRLENLHLLGVVANANIPSVYRQADCLLLPSLEEGVSVSGLEAMACGLAIVGTNVGGNPEIIKPEMNGLLVEPGSAVELSEAINRLIRNRQLCEDMGRRSRDMVVKDYSWSAISEQHLSVYLQACS